LDLVLDLNLDSYLDFGFAGSLILLSRLDFKGVYFWNTIQKDGKMNQETGVIFAVLTTNKRSHVIDRPAGRQRLCAILEGVEFQFSSVDNSTQK
jgi:hypothetical protein